MSPVPKDKVTLYFVPANAGGGFKSRLEALHSGMKALGFWCHLNQKSVEVRAGDESKAINLGQSLGLRVVAQQADLPPEDVNPARYRFPLDSGRPGCDGKPFDDAERSSTRTERRKRKPDAQGICDKGDAGWTCTRPPGHEGDHVASAVDDVIWRWPQETGVTTPAAPPVERRRPIAKRDPAKSHPVAVDLASTTPCECKQAMVGDVTGWERDAHSMWVREHRAAPDPCRDGVLTRAEFERQYEVEPE